MPEPVVVDPPDASVPPADPPPTDPPAPAPPAPEVTPPKPPPAADPPKVVFEAEKLTIPEGGLVDESDRARIVALAQSQQWSTEDAQAALEETKVLREQEIQDFKKTLVADPDYGGDHLAETQQLAKKVIEFVRPEGHARRASFLAFFNKNGAGDHIEVVSFLADLGKAMTEDGSPLVRSGSTPPEPPSNLAEALYGRKKAVAS